MSSADTNRNLELLEADTTSGCGCGGCGCGTTATDTTPATTAPRATKEATMTSTSYSVTGMTCGHCAGAVTSELTALDGVTAVQVDLVAGGDSTVTVTSDRPLEDAQVAAALDEAGGYRLA